MESSSVGAIANSGVERFDRPRRASYNAAMAKQAVIEPVEHARLAVDVASERLASDVVMLDIRELSDFADYFVIMTAESSRQIRSLVEEIEDTLEAAGATLHHREGTSDSGWMLLDFGDLIVHMFGPEKREYYSIEAAWSGAVEVLRIQ